jgi:hypothetical protein
MWYGKSAKAIIITLSRRHVILSSLLDAQNSLNAGGRFVFQEAVGFGH